MKDSIKEKGTNRGLMTQGVIWKQLLLFAIPLLLGNLFQLLYNTVDSVVVGNYIGGNALAAVGASNPIINLLVGLFMGIATGAGVVISRYFGAQDRENVHEAVHTAVAFALASGVVLMVLGAILSPYLLQWIGTPPEVLDGAITYLQVYFYGILFTMVYNMGSGILRAVGDSKNPLYYLIVASIVNIVLDLLFVIKFQMGIGGVAWATLTAQGISAVLVLLKLMRTSEMYRLHLSHIHFNFPILKETIRVGLPSGLQNAIVSFSNVIVQVNINSFGAAAVAGCASYNKIDGFAALPVMSFSMAVTTFVGQNMGAGNHERVKKGMKSCLILSTSIVAVLSILLMIFGRYILRIFSSDPQIVYYGNYMLMVLAPGYVFLAVAQALCGVVRGAGKATVPMLVLVGNMCVVRIIWISIMMPLLNSILVVFLGYTLTWITSALCMVLYVRRARWLFEAA